MGIFTWLWGRKKNNAVRRNTAGKPESIPTVEECVPPESPGNKPSQTISVQCNAAVHQEDVTLWNRKCSEKPSPLGLVIDENLSSDLFNEDDRLLGEIQTVKNGDVPQMPLSDSLLEECIALGSQPSKEFSVQSNVENQEDFTFRDWKCSEKRVSETKKIKTAVEQKSTLSESKSTPPIEESIASNLPLHNPANSFGKQYDVDNNQKDDTFRNRNQRENRSSLILIKDEDLRQDSFAKDVGNEIPQVRLSQQGIFTWKNSNAFIYKVDSSFPSNDHTLEFVLYIPIDTAVQWFREGRRSKGGSDYDVEHEGRRSNKRGKTSKNSGEKGRRTNSRRSDYDTADKEKNYVIGDDDMGRTPPRRSTNDWGRDGRGKSVKSSDGGREKTRLSNKNYVGGENGNRHGSERGRSAADVGTQQEDEGGKRSYFDEGTSKNSDEKKKSHRLTDTSLTEKGYSIKDSAPRENQTLTSDNKPPKKESAQNKPTKKEPKEVVRNKPKNKKYRDEKNSETEGRKQTSKDKSKSPQKNKTKDKGKENEPGKKKKRKLGDTDSETSITGPGEFYLKRPKTDVNIEKMPAHRVKIGKPTPRCAQVCQGSAHERPTETAYALRDGDEEVVVVDIAQITPHVGRPTYNYYIY